MEKKKKNKMIKLNFRIIIIKNKLKHIKRKKNLIFNGYKKKKKNQKSNGFQKNKISL